MLTPFPQLLVFGFFAPTLLRLTAAGVFFYLAIFHWRNRAAAAKELTFLTHEMARSALGVYMLAEAAVALGLLAGYYTQIAAIVGLVMVLKILVIRRGMHHLAPLSRLSYVLLGVVCASLLLTGAGALAFDLPL